DAHPRMAPPKAGRVGLLGMLAAVRDEPEERAAGATSLGEALLRAGALARQRSIVVVVSDFRGPRDWRRPLLELAGRHDVVAVEIRDPREEELPNLVAAGPGIRRHLPLALLFVALTAMIVGVARPHAKVSVAREEATVMIAIDSSLSMRATDVRPTRLYAARQAAKAFVAKVPKKSRVGLISFAAGPHVLL